LCRTIEIPDPRGDEPNLAARWSKVNSDPFTSTFVAEMCVAADVYLATLRCGHGKSRADGVVQFGL
jgi:hypothetical protein